MSSVFKSVTFQTVAVLSVRRRGYRSKCWVRGFRCPGLEIYGSGAWTFLATTSGDFSACECTRLRREALSVLDVALVAAECFVATTSLCRRGFLSRRIARDYFPRSFFADCRAHPHLHLFATDASPLAGACSTPASLELWTLLFDLFGREGLLSEV